MDGADPEMYTGGQLRDVLRLEWVVMGDMGASLFLIFSATFKMSVIIPLEMACLHAEAL